MEEKFTITVPGQGDVSAIATTPVKPVARILMAHGAGAGLTHRFMDRASMELFDRQIAVVRYNFPYMQQGRKYPDSKKKAIATVKAIVDYVTADDSLPWFIGGKSYGGRISSECAAIYPEIPITGLIFWGFPLHAPGRPSSDRGAHLADIKQRMLFLQGTRDALADLSLLRPMVDSLPNAEIHICQEADHSFHVLKRSGRTDAEVMTEIHDKILDWI